MAWRDRPQLGGWGEVWQGGGVWTRGPHSPSSASVMGRWLSTHSSDLPSTVSTPLSTIWPTREPMTDWTPLVTADLVASTPVCTAPRVMSTAPVTRVATVSLALDTASRAPDTLDETSSLVSAKTYNRGSVSISVLSEDPHPCTPASKDPKRRSSSSWVTPKGQHATQQ